MGIAGETIKEISIKVSQYFLDFLESDFKRQQAPRRRIVLQNESGFRSAMRVAAYPLLQHNIWQILGKRSEGDPSLKFQPKVYSRPISNTLRTIIKEQIQVITNDELLRVRAAVLAEATDSRGMAIDNPEEWVDHVRTKVAEEVGAQIVAPLLALLDGPLSDRSDEALLNDYEEMITQARLNQPGVMELFQGMVGSVLLENPKSIASVVDAEWDGRSMVDRVVIDSPVPLNEEQIKILSAIQSPHGRIIVVEGPPGTGKSHTITAIAADCALKGKSCLILSDKAEALNVVQDKLSNTMSQVRHSKDFVNPILRLGQDQANFKKLTSQQTLTQISAYVRASKANEQRIIGELSDTREMMKDRIERTKSTLGSVSLKELADFHAAEKEVDAISPDLKVFLQRLRDETLVGDLTDAANNSDEVGAYLVDVFRRGASDIDTMEKMARLDAAALDLAEQVDSEALALFESCSSQQLSNLTRWLLEFDQLKMPVFGYLLRGGAVRAIERDLNEAMRPTRPILMRREIGTLRDVQRYTIKLKAALVDHALDESALPHIYAAIAQGRFAPPVAISMRRLLKGLQKGFCETSPAVLFTGEPEELAARWTTALKYLHGWNATTAAFLKAPEFDYAGSKSVLERLNVSVMNTEVDKRLVNFMDTSRADARVLSSIIANRQKFPEEKFDNVKNAFPVIIANIRQFGEYMPLAPGVFDVVVIDEASQVSVAQAFPAMLRAKKLVVLGDSKQFSNTKSSNASIALNEKYKAELNAYFKQKVANDAGTLQRLSRFDVKCSILEFCQLCANYSIMLRKHFRSYQELISYSSQTFYGSQLQAIKIRGVPIEEVIRFDQIDVGDAKTTRGTNEAEARFILEQLLELLEEENPPTVGIITPFTDKNSPMEAKVLDWLQKTSFYQKHRDRLEILPQFPIGDYLRQLDPTYKHPAWRVDFLVTYASDNGSAMSSVSAASETGSTGLADLFCSKVRNRASFDPATDKDGRPAQGAYKSGLKLSIDARVNSKPNCQADAFNALTKGC